ncbi:MAG: response regulator [Nitrospirae bacterium]|nr:response regulator [Nitrospirota bacterium]
MRKILIVDDEIKICEAFREMFEKEYVVLTACDGKEALRLIRDESPELIVLDWRLKSTVEGKDVLIFAKRNYPQIPVYVVTASVHSREEIKSLGADLLLFKPCEEIREIILEALSEH